MTGTEPTDPIVSSRVTVSGVQSDRQVKDALQDLYDVFVAAGLGQATFEVRDDGTADLFVKHLASVSVDRGILDQALARAGDFRIVDGPVLIA